MSIRILLHPIPARGPIEFCEVSLATPDAGDPLSATPADARIELHELPRRGDAAQSPRLLGTIRGRLRLEGNQPKFTHLGFTPAPGNTQAETDVFLTLRFDEARVDMGTPNWLYLPWDSLDEGRTYEVGAKLFMGETLLADLAQNDSIDVPTSRPNVYEGAMTADRATARGVTRFTPQRNTFGRIRLPVGDRAVNVHIHRSLRELSSITADGLRPKVEQIIRSAGFETIAVAERSDAEAQAIWHRRGTRWGTRSVGDLDHVLELDDDGLGRITDEHGEDIPFFDYWIFYSRHLSDSPPEDNTGVAQSESLHPRHTYDARASTKRVILPIHLGGDRFFSAFEAVGGAERKLTFVANLIVHEIGHSFGLAHCLFRPSPTAPYGPANHTLEVMCDADGERVKQFGPVNRQIIRAAFLPAGR